MATVNFSVPDDVRNAFNREFRGQNKSAIIAELMRRAVADARRLKQRADHFPGADGPAQRAAAGARSRYRSGQEKGAAVTLVIDASVIIKWLLQDPERESSTAQATALMEAVIGARVQVLQPFHWLAEIAAVLSRLSPGTAADDVLLVQALALPTTDDPPVLRRACVLAARYDAHAFDTLYHAVALETPEGVLITADAAYHRMTRQTGQIRMLENWQAPES